MFDKVLFLGRGGRTVYSGSVEGAKDYFSSIGFPLPRYMNPADFYLDVISDTVKSEENTYTDLFERWQDYQTRIESVVDVNADAGKIRKKAWEEEDENEGETAITNGKRVMFCYLQCSCSSSSLF